jgi:hypothetical protein
MKRARSADNARDAQAASPVGQLLIDLLSDPSSALYSHLRVCDLFCVRLSCKAAWRRIPHKPLTKSNLWQNAFNGMFEVIDPHIPMVRWCIRQKLMLLEETAETVGATGNTSLIEEFIATYGRTNLVELFGGAVSSGVAEAALNLFPQLRPADLARFDAFNMKQRISTGGLVEVAQLIYPDRGCFNGNILCAALQSGRTEFVQWVLSGTAIDSTLAERAVRDAAMSGSVELVRWLADEKGCPKTEDALLVAARDGKLELLRWLHVHGSGDLQEAVKHAARYGQCHVLEWLFEQGCQMTEEALYEAAEGSTTSTIVWLMDRGCPYVEQTLVERSCKNFYDDILVYLIETKGIPYSAEKLRQYRLVSMCTPYVEAALHRLVGRPLGKSFFEDAVAVEDICLVRYALGHKASFTPAALCKMFEQDEDAMLTETLEYFLVHGTDQDELREAMRGALREASHVSGSMVEAMSRYARKVQESDSDA